MEGQHIDLDIGALKHKLVLDTETPEIKNLTNAVFYALSSRIKSSLKNIPEEKRANTNALVDTFLKENLKRTFSTIINTQCAVSPETVKILTKEATAEVSSELSRELSTLSKEIDAFALQQEITYQRIEMQTVKKKIELYKHCKEAQQYIVSCCEKVLQSKEIKKFDKSRLELALAQDKSCLEDFTQSLDILLMKEEEDISILEESVEKKKEMRSEENILDLEKYALDRIVEKFRAHLSNDRLRPNVYFYLKELTDENSKYIREEKIEALEKHSINSKAVFSASRMAEKLRIEEKERISMGKFMIQCGQEMVEQVHVLVEFGHAYFTDVLNRSSTFELVSLLRTVKMNVKNLQEPEKTELKEFLMVLEDFDYGINWIRDSSFIDLQRIKDTLKIDHLLEKLSDARVRNKFARFNDGFRKILEKFPNGETKSGYDKAFYALRSHPRTKHETAKQMHDNAMEAEEHLTRLRGVDEGTTRKDCDLRVAAYEKFARETEMPDFSGAIENIPPESLEDGVTPREIKAMLSNMNILHDICTEELEDEARTDSEKEVLRKSLPEIEEKIQVLNQKLRSFNKELSEEEAQKNECLRYAYLTKYKNECLKRIFTVTKNVEAEMVPLAKEVMKEIEETPNSPEFNEKVEKMLEEIIEKEPHRLLTPEFIVENEYFWEELPKTVDQLDREIAEALGGSSGEGTGGKSKYHFTLQNSILALFFVFMILSLGLVCNSEFA
ncbi:uncharacterized protein NEMAJ01_1010 [Nematocida major]|uniref:uncharacterized protein n=1 Tax=Nematocida major TaxID=1912982 RepID=UPI0020084511|nr:uncharacterized protein NEMAJ01_1010 [Nematocida major]KAH9386114.1 hypothetical protein NEMAJ01_1010 [Nematocida major]